MSEPWNFTETQKRQFREAQAASKLRRQADADEGITYRVIYRFGSTEVPSMWTHGTRGEAEAEEQGADDEGLDETWIEEVTS